MFGLFELPTLADLFWMVATSTIVLIALAAVGVVGRLASWIALVLPIGPAWLKLARLASTLALLAFVFLIGFRLSDERSEIKQTARDLRFARWQIDNLQRTADDADRLRSQAEQHVGELERKAAAYANERDRTRQCSFNRFDVERLSDIK